MNGKMKETLCAVADALNAAGIIWCVGGSALLELYGWAQEPHDLDLIVALPDAAQADNILGKLGRKAARERSPAYSTNLFCEYTIGGVELDLMGGFCINCGGTSYPYPFDAASVAERDGGIPYGAPEDWFVLYLLMGRQEKAAWVVSVLRRDGVRRRDLLERFLAQGLPQDIAEAVRALLAAPEGDGHADS